MTIINLLIWCFLIIWSISRAKYHFEAAGRARRDYDRVDMYLHFVLVGLFGVLFVLAGYSLGQGMVR
jgi:hypothetical protein